MKSNIIVSVGTSKSGKRMERVKAIEEEGYGGCCGVTTMFVIGRYRIPLGYTSQRSTGLSPASNDCIVIISIG